MKIGFYDPYLDTMGGGEKYFLDAATYLSQKSHKISFFWPPNEKPDIAQKAKERFHTDIASFSFVPNIFSSRQSFLKKYNVTKSFDAIFYLSDGSIPFLFAKNNILMFQHPVDWVKPSLANSLKLQKIQTIICNSQFTKEHIDKVFGATKTKVIYPSVANIKNGDIAKQHIVLSVGRFTQGSNTKKQEEMIIAFKNISERLKGWRFVIIGGVQMTDEDYFQKLEEQTKGYPITLLKNINRSELVSYYNKAMIYWHAAGLGEDLTSHPERAEHFGIATVEAMSAGCVPVVFAAGGQTEIVTNGVNGYTWLKKEELEAYTEKLAQDSNLFSQLGEKAKERAKDFDPTRFDSELSKLVSS